MSCDSLSDEDIFWGPMTLKEVKRRLLGKQNKNKPPSFTADNSTNEIENSNGMQILESQSVTNLLPSNSEDIQQTASEDTTLWYQLPEDDSFIKLERIVEKLYVSSVKTGSSEDIIKNPLNVTNKTEVERENTMDILNVATQNDKQLEKLVSLDHSDSKIKSDNIKENFKVLVKTGEQCLSKSQVSNEELEKNAINRLKYINTESGALQKTLQRNKYSGNVTTPKNKKVDGMIQEIVDKTPSKTKPEPNFRTPAQSLSNKKPFASDLRKTRIKPNAFRHIASPVAAYIKSSTSLATGNDLHHKKPLLGPSLIPKLKSDVPLKFSNKENNIQPLAHKTAKKSTLSDATEQRLSERHSAKKLSSLPRPLAQTHQDRLCRTLNPVENSLQDSIADLLVQQAEVSQCT